MTISNKPLSIVGASGLVGSNIVKAALNRGYSVRGVMRDKEAPDKAPYLMALPGASERLTLFSGNMANEDDFDAPLAGADCVFIACLIPIYAGPTGKPAREMDDERQRQGRAVGHGSALLVLHRLRSKKLPRCWPVIPAEPRGCRVGNCAQRTDRVSRGRRRSFPTAGRASPTERAPRRFGRSSARSRRFHEGKLRTAHGRGELRAPAQSALRAGPRSGCSGSVHTSLQHSAVVPAAVPAEPHGCPVVNCAHGRGGVRAGRARRLLLGKRGEAAQ